MVCLGCSGTLTGADASSDVLADQDVPDVRMDQDASVSGDADQTVEDTVPDMPGNSDTLLQNLAADGVEDMRGLRAFPGADGFGQMATGGRGGVVVTVTTTQDNCIAGDGEITWREAITACGDVNNSARYVVFAVAGTFPRSLNEMLAKGNVTVACQTAPGPVVFQETLHFFNQSNVVFRYCHHRGNGTPAFGPGTDRALNFADSSDVILDHLSISWHQDAEFQAYNAASTSIPNARITLQHSIAGYGDGSEPTTPGTTNSALGPHCLSNHATLTVQGCSFLSNYSVHNWSRMLGQWGADGEILNNIAYNFYDNAVGSVSSPGSYPPSSMFAINNIVIDGPMAGDNNRPYNTASDAARAVQRGNYVLEGMPYQGTVASAPSFGVEYSGTPSISQSGAVIEDIRTLAANADTPFMKCLGASKWGHDVFDAQWIADLYAKTGPTEPELGTPPRDYSSYQALSHPADYDTDADGIADDWERMLIQQKATVNSLADIDQNTDIDSDGYSSLEEFLAWRARCVP